MGQFPPRLPSLEKGPPCRTKAARRRRFPHGATDAINGGPHAAIKQKNIRPLARLRNAASSYCGSANVLGLRAYQRWVSGLGFGHLPGKLPRRPRRPRPWAPVIGPVTYSKAKSCKSHSDSDSECSPTGVTIPRNRSGMMPQASVIGMAPCGSHAWNRWPGNVAKIIGQDLLAGAPREI